ncbi:hypothetical protein [Alishewanella longhuensis]
MQKSLRGFSVTAMIAATAAAIFIIGLIGSTILHAEYTRLGDTLQQATDEFQLALNESRKINIALAHFKRKPMFRDGFKRYAYRTGASMAHLRYCLY